MIGCVDRIFTRIRSLDSVSVGLSTFMIDVNQVSTKLIMSLYICIELNRIISFSDIGIVSLLIILLCRNAVMYFYAPLDQRTGGGGGKLFLSFCPPL